MQVLCGMNYVEINDITRFPRLTYIAGRPTTSIIMVYLEP